jgi:hypothetical protein
MISFFVRPELVEGRNGARYRGFDKLTKNGNVG